MIPYRIREALHALQWRAAVDRDADLAPEIAALTQAVEEEFSDAELPDARVLESLPWYRWASSRRRAFVVIGAVTLIAIVELALLFLWMFAVVP